MHLPADLDVTPYLPASYQLTDHARQRMSQRGISLDALSAAVHFGRISVERGGAEVFLVGRKEVVQAYSQGFDLSPYEGVQVVCSMHGAVLTAYRAQRRRRQRHKTRLVHRHVNAAL